MIRPLPEFTEQNDRSKLASTINYQKVEQYFQEDQLKGKQEENEEYQLENINDNSIYSYYFKLKAPLIYQKFDNSNSNSIPYTKKKYFASYFCNIKDLITDESGKFLQVQDQLLKKTNNQLYVEKIEENQQNYNSDYLKTITTEQSTPKKQIKQNDCILLNLNKKYGSLKFDSNFESGNLFAVFKISENEYDLILQNDINTKGNTQWFFFSVQNMLKNQSVKFNIVNFLKNDSLFNCGMKPVVFSELENKQNGSSWQREGQNQIYERGNILREGSGNKFYYKLSFCYKFKHSQDTVYFAHCFPYTYSDLVQFTNQLFTDPTRLQFISKKLLCHSIAKNKCDIYTISSPSYFTGNMSQADQSDGEASNLKDVLQDFKSTQSQKSQKKIVFLTARQHPGETPSSYMIQGAMEFLTDPNNQEAIFLREHFIFKIVPMLNPDGVIHGNYRCSLSGVDLNRQWKDPSKELHPTIYFTKNAILKYSSQKKCRFLCDFHGHSKNFFYGNPYKEDPYIPKIIPMEGQNLNKAIEFRSCTFKLSEDKESTFRQALLNEMPDNPFIYTFEASFFGCQIQYAKNHFSIDDFKSLGRDVIRGFYMSVKEEIEEQLRLFNLPTPSHDQNFSKQEQALNHKYSQHIHSLIDSQGLSNEVDNDGSDSNPSEDELSKKELNSLSSQQFNPQKRQNRSFSNTKNNFFNSPQKQINKYIEKEQRSLSLILQDAEISTVKKVSSQKVDLLFY